MRRLDDAVVLMLVSYSNDSVIDMNDRRLILLIPKLFLLIVIIIVLTTNPVVVVLMIRYCCYRCCDRPVVGHRTQPGAVIVMVVVRLQCHVTRALGGIVSS
jgi:hypothetical protein